MSCDRGWARFFLSHHRLLTPDFLSCCARMSNVLLLFPPIMGSIVSPLCHLSHLSHWLPVALPLQLIIGFESGIVVLWDLKSKKVENRYTYDEVGKSPLFPFFSRSFQSILPLLIHKNWELNHIFMNWTVYSCVCVCVCVREFIPRTNLVYEIVYYSWQGLRGENIYCMYIAYSHIQHGYKPQTIVSSLICWWWYEKRILTQNWPKSDIWIITLEKHIGSNYSNIFFCEICPWHRVLTGLER